MSQKRKQRLLIIAFTSFVLMTGLLLSPTGSTGLQYLLGKIISTAPVSVSVSIQVAPPRNVTVAQVGKDKVRVAWGPSLHTASGSVDGYKIYFKKNSEADYEHNRVVYLPATELKQNIEDLTVGEAYDFFVRTFTKSMSESRADCSECEVRNFRIVEQKNEVSTDDDEKDEEKTEKHQSFTKDNQGKKPSLTDHNEESDKKVWGGIFTILRGILSGQTDSSFDVWRITGS